MVNLRVTNESLYLMVSRQNLEVPLKLLQVDLSKFILRMEKRRIPLLNERYFYVKANILMYML